MLLSLFFHSVFFFSIFIWNDAVSKVPELFVVDWFQVSCLETKECRFS